MGRWVFLGAILTACNGGGTQGGAGDACYPNSTCNTGLVCTTNQCVAATPGVAGGPCYPNDTCNAGLVCQTGVCSAPGIDAGVDAHMSVDAQPMAPDASSGMCSVTASQLCYEVMTANTECPPDAPNPYGGTGDCSAVYQFHTDGSAVYALEVFTTSRADEIISIDGLEQNLINPGTCSGSDPMTCDGQIAVGGGGTVGLGAGDHAIYLAWAASGWTVNIWIHE
jgi:hypothetical protein